MLDDLYISDREVASGVKEGLLASKPFCAVLPRSWRIQTCKCMGTKPDKSIGGFGGNLTVVIAQ